MSSLVGALLEQSRNRLAMQGRKEPVDVSSIAEEIADCFIMLGTTQRKEVLTDITQDVRIEGNPLQVRIIIENLLGNALFYTPMDSRIELHLSHADGVARLTVRDQGPGVPEEYLNAIFRPFFRVDESRTRQSGGVGLGLALVREASQAMGGSVVAKNTYPGLEVTVMLPLLQ